MCCCYINDGYISLEGVRSFCLGLHSQKHGMPSMIMEGAWGSRKCVQSVFFYHSESAGKCGLSSNPSNHHYSVKCIALILSDAYSVTVIQVKVEQDF